MPADDRRGRQRACQPNPPDKTESAVLSAGRASVPQILKHISRAQLHIAGRHVVRFARGGSMRPNGIVDWFVHLLAELGVSGCSSRAGRRTFITATTRNDHRAGCGLRDAQLPAGDRSIANAQLFIDGDTESQPSSCH